jgi:molybdopterin-guanine dinucleotide biosynthesis protein A
MVGRFANITAAVLAGGRSSRMGTDKALLELDGKPLLDIALEKCGGFSRVLISANDAAKYARFGASVVPDLIPGQGPMSGFHAALKAAETDYVFFLSCDMPLVPEDFIASMAEKVQKKVPGTIQAVVPFAGGFWQPLCSIYHKSCVPLIEDALSRGEHRMRKLFPLLATWGVNAEENWFTDVDTQEAYESLKSLKFFGR